jgi:hypothetical protein
MLFSTPHLQASLFKPYEVRAFRSDTKHRQKRKTPEGVYTCWEINTYRTAWSDTVPCCVPCGRFKAEKGLTPRLIKLKSNRDSVRAYQCMTFWQDSDTGGTKNNNVVVSSPQGGSYELLVASERPSKRRNVSPVSPVFYEAATPSPVKKRASAPPAKEPKSKATDELQCFCDELEVRLKISSDDLAEAEKETEQAVGDRRRLQQQYENAQQMCTDQLLLHQQLVSELKLRLQDVDDLRKADATYIESLEADANREHLPVPQNVTEIPFCLEYITDCASNKGAHLPSRLKLLCESVWPELVYNGQC